MTGRVTLMGAGPGDPDLLTVRATRRLADADLVLFDALAGQDMRALAPEARWFYVGKRAGRESMAQEAINRLMIREARRGQLVVRLKGGDPFVLGRGGEEALALAAAGVAFEVVPGVSSAIAAPALAGIPVTHRGLASAFVVVSGHAPAAYGPVLDALAPVGLTVVVLMGFGTRADIAARLLARGFAPTTPAALVVGAATPEAFRWLGTLAELGSGDLPDVRDRVAAGAPVLLVVGAVVALADTLAPLAQVTSAGGRAEAGGRGER
jgi:uroporphyrin-III C-methyltransferase / precorrin-2 dehydrogenase / sirohydrochlorin ferrochelatase